MIILVIFLKGFAEVLNLRLMLLYFLLLCGDRIHDSLQLISWYQCRAASCLMSIPCTFGGGGLIIVLATFAVFLPT